MAKAADASNTFDKAVVQSLVNRLEDCADDIDSERGKFMSACKVIRERMNDLFTEADARGVPKKELKALIQAREKSKQARGIIAKLDADRQETAAMLAEAFGDARDLPLFDDKIKKTAAAEAAGQAATH